MVCSPLRTRFRAPSIPCFSESRSKRIISIGVRHSASAEFECQNDEFRNCSRAVSMFLIQNCKFIALYQLSYLATGKHAGSLLDKADRPAKTSCGPLRHTDI